MATKISDLSIPSSGCGDIHLAFDGLQLRVRYEVSKNGKDLVGEALFFGVRGFRFRDEMLSGGSVEGTYDTLVVLQDSEWAHELETKGPSGTDLSTLTHYAALLSSNGYLEVLAENVELKAPEDAALDSR